MGPPKVPPQSSHSRAELGVDGLHIAQCPGMVPEATAAANEPGAYGMGFTSLPLLPSVSTLAPMPTLEFSKR